jgi:hypothetical protein
MIVRIVVPAVAVEVVIRVLFCVQVIGNVRR